jgi:hypothetical protein
VIVSGGCGGWVVVGADEGDQLPWSSESGGVVLGNRAHSRSTYSAVHRVMVVNCSSGTGNWKRQFLEAGKKGLIRDQMRAAFSNRPLARTTSPAASPQRP